MPKESHYQLIKDMYQVVNRIEDKMDQRFSDQDKRIDNIDDEVTKLGKDQENFKGRIGVLFTVGMILVGGAVSFAFDWMKQSMFGKH